MRCHFLQDLLWTVRLVSQKNIKCCPTPVASGWSRKPTATERVSEPLEAGALNSRDKQDPCLVLSIGAFPFVRWKAYALHPYGPHKFSGTPAFLPHLKPKFEQGWPVCTMR
jgi:hypothetical protein